MHIFFFLTQISPTMAFKILSVKKLSSEHHLYIQIVSYCLVLPQHHPALCQSNTIPLNVELPQHCCAKLYVFVRMGVPFPRSFITVLLCFFECGWVAFFGVVFFSLPKRVFAPCNIVHN